MTVSDIQKVTIDEVCIYREMPDFNFEDIFKGKVFDIPAEFLSAQVESISASCKYMINIVIK